MSWNIIVSAGFVLYALYGLVSGRIAGLGSERRSADWVYRSKKPGTYWFYIVVLLALAAFFYLNIFHW